jgi:hypothetical protein
MSAPKKPTPEEEAMLAERGLSVIDMAKINDKWMAKYTDHVPLPDDQTPDVLEELEMAWGMHVGMDDGGDAE